MAYVVPWVPNDILKDLKMIKSDDGKTLYLNSSTEDSKKVFAITVDDDGELTATEVS